MVEDSYCSSVLFLVGGCGGMRQNKPCACGSPLYTFHIYTSILRYNFKNIEPVVCGTDDSALVTS